MGISDSRQRDAIEAGRSDPPSVGWGRTPWYWRVIGYGISFTLFPLVLAVWGETAMLVSAGALIAAAIWWVWAYERNAGGPQERQTDAEWAARDWLGRRR